ncbi:MAG: hypothetical protein CRU78_08590 [Candidatus Accumulibacter phosphatis]|uniref:Tetratricopeptide repeat protein n=1 Tax=Candidatus Accumulibacter phosphatis TaxID=327160 RepID=A0A6A7RSL8_9PROT|nr:hypothetical protein [Candidatus Accumulibacter phosphatis]
MRMNSKPLLRHALTTLLLVLSFAELRAAEEAAENDWQIDNATLTVVPSFQQLADGAWRERRSRSGNTFLEVRGTLKVAGDGSFGPHRLATARLLAGAGEVPIAAELLAVGTNTGICRYLRAPIGAGNETTAKLRNDREITILRENSDNGPLLLRMHAHSVELCMVFELPEAPPPSLRWSFAHRTMPLSVSAATSSNAATQTTTAASNSGLEASSAAAAASFSVPPTWRRAISSPLLWSALALAALALLGSVALQRWWRRRRLAIAARRDYHSESSSALDIPRVSAAHQPKNFASVEPEGGAGQLQFLGAMAALRLGDWEQANALFGEAIAVGLTPTFEAGAWSLRGETMLNDHDLVGATNCYLRALSCPGVTAEAALPAASQLAAIYRQLRLRRDAQKMEALRALINPFADDLGPQQLALIARLVKELKHKRRTRMLARLVP